MSQALFILKSFNREDDDIDSIGVGVFSSKEALIAAFIRDWENWNNEVYDEDLEVDVAGVTEPLRAEGRTRVFETDFVIEEHDLRS